MSEDNKQSWKWLTWSNSGSMVLGSLATMAIIALAGDRWVFRWELFVRVIESVLGSYPVAILLLGIVFREPLARLVDRIIKLGGPNWFEAPIPAEPVRDDPARETATLPAGTGGESSSGESVESLRLKAAAGWRSYHFERIWATLWGTHLDLLRHLAAEKDVGLDFPAVNHYYGEAVRRSSGARFPLPKFLEPVLVPNLMKMDAGGMYHITPRGTEFLEFVAREHGADRRPY